MAETVVAPVNAQAIAPTAASDGIPPAVLDTARAAQFPAALGDPSTFIRAGQLDAKDPKARTVSHLIAASGIRPYKALGHRVSSAIEAMNKAATPGFSLNAIRRDFISLDMEKLAALSPADRSAAVAAFDRFTASLKGEAPPAVTRDGVEPRRAQVDTTGGRVRANPLQPTGKPTTVEPLPLDHAALQGTSPQWQAWLARGDNRMQTVESLLGQRPESFEAGLDQVTSRFKLGTEGRPANLEALGTAVQTELNGSAFGAGGGPGQIKVDGKVGKGTDLLLAGARDTVKDRVATAESRAELRAELERFPTIADAIIPPEAGPVEATVDPTREAAPQPRTGGLSPTERDEAAPTVVPAPAPTGPDYAALAQLRTAGGEAWTTKRTELIGKPPAEVANSIGPAMSADPALANELVKTYLDANTSGALGYNGNNPVFARALFDGASKSRIGELSQENLTRLGAIVNPTFLGATTAVPNADRPTAAAFDDSFILQARSASDLTRDPARLRRMFDLATPAVVADAYKRFNDIGAQAELANQFTSYIQSGGSSESAAIQTRIGRVTDVLRAMRAEGIAQPTIDAWQSWWRLNNYTISGNLVNTIVANSALPQ